MKINEKENQLFKEWRSFLQLTEDEFVNDGLLFHDCLHWDGYSYVRTESGNNTENWLNAKRRLLIVTRDQPAEKGDIWDVRGDYPLTKNGEFKRNNMYKCLIQWGFAAINFDSDEICPDDESKIKFWETGSIARMNCGKVAGKRVKNGGCNRRKVIEYLETQKDFILEQLKIYDDANIIMCCSGTDTKSNPIVDFIKAHYLHNLEKINNYVYASKERKTMVIDSYHFANPLLWSDDAKMEEAKRIRHAMIDAYKKGYSLE